MWFKKKLMPDLRIYDEADGAVLPEIKLRKVPSIANEIANVLAKENLDLRNSAVAISHVLGWLAFQVQQSGNDPKEFMSHVTEQTLNYCREFSRCVNSGE